MDTNEEFIKLPQVFSAGNDEDVYSEGVLNVANLRFSSFFIEQLNESFDIKNIDQEESALLSWSAVRFDYEPATEGNYREYDIGASGLLKGVPFILKGKFNVERGCIIASGVYGEYPISSYMLEYVPN